MATWGGSTAGNLESIDEDNDDEDDDDEDEDDNQGAAAGQNGEQMSVLLVVNTGAFDCLERLVSEMTYYVSSGTLNLTHSVTHFLFLSYEHVANGILLWVICSGVCLTGNVFLWLMSFYLVEGFHWKLKQMFVMLNGSTENFEMVWRSLVGGQEWLSN